MREDPIIIVSEGCTTPSKISEKEDLMNDLRDAVEDVLAEYNAEPDICNLYEGDIYAGTNNHVQCPDCRERLKLTSVEPGPENDVTASARCECGWSGEARYKLVDLQNHSVEEIEGDTQAKIDPDLDREATKSKSCVARGQCDVTYYAYEGTDWYSGQELSDDSIGES